MDIFRNVTDMIMSGNRSMVFTFNRVWCKIMMQRWLGPYLENNLSLDQLSIELSQGFLKLEGLEINTKVISQIFTQKKIPFKLVDGYIGQITIEVPWFNMTTQPTKMTIEDLQLSLRPADVIKVDDIEETITSMIGSVINGLNSEDMARSVFEEVSKESSRNCDTFGTDDTADTFSNLINAVYSRFCLTVKQLTIRLENVALEGSETATAVEIHVDMVTFMDEQMRSCEMDKTNADLVTTQPHGLGSASNLSKNITFTGVTVYTDVFTELKNKQIDPENVLITSMHIRREKAKQMSPTKSTQGSLSQDMFMSAMSDMDAFHSCYDKLTQECQPDHLETVKDAPDEPEIFSDPIKCAEVIGDIVIQFTSKTGENDVNTANVDEQKYEVGVSVKGVNVFATPSQINIFQRFISLVAAPKEIKILEQGKPMRKEDYEEMTKNMEQNHTPDAPLAGASFGNNWHNTEVFTEFEDQKSSKQKEKEKAAEEFKSLKNHLAVKEESTFRMNIGTILVYIPHTDYLSTEYASRGWLKALQNLRTESEYFFAVAKGFSFVSKYGLEQIREEADSFYPKDHLRIVGGSIATTTSAKKIGNVSSLQTRFVASQFEMLEYLAPESVPGQKEPVKVPILDYTAQENPELDPNFKMVISKSSDVKKQTNVDILLGAVASELDFSIIDRISNLIVTKPFYDEVSAKRGKQNKIPQLRDDIYADTMEEENVVKAKTIVNVKCKNWQIDLRIPKADLRDPNGARLPYAQRHVHNELIRLGIKDIEVRVPVGDEVSTIDIVCAEMSGDFCGTELNIPKEQQRFLYATRSGLDRVNLKLVFNQKKHSPFERKSSTAIPDIMIRSAAAADLINSHPKKEGPFSKTTRAYFSHSGEESGEIVEAGTRQEILDFQHDCENFASSLLYFTVPSLKLHIPEKSHLEVLYNRLVNDLALFQPAAPAFRAQPDGFSNQLPLDSFQECMPPKNYGKPYAHDDFTSFRTLGESDHSDLEDDVDTLQNSVESIGFDREVPHSFVLTLNANKCAILCNTFVKEEDKDSIASQVALDLENVHIGTTAGYHGDINHTFFHFTTQKAAVGAVDISKSSRFNNVITAKDFGKWNKDLTQLENISATDELSTGSVEDAFAVALYMNFRPDVNVKDVILGIALRNSQLQAKPYKNMGAFWMVQLADAFTLQDYAIPGYELPTVTTDLQICFQNAVLAYDHSCVNPSSKMKLKAFLGQCHLASSIVSSMNLSKTLCVLEQSRLYMSRGHKETVRFEGSGSQVVGQKRFIPFLDIGSVQFDIMFAVGEDTSSRTFPAFEIRCQNDLVKVWACADSLSTFINMVMEYANNADQPAPEDRHQEEMEQTMKTDSIARSVAGESVWSDASTGTKHIQKMNIGTELPAEVNRRVQEQIQEAVDEECAMNEGIAFGQDAVEEFSMTPSKKLFDESNDSFEHVAQMMYVTDDEFCMVDDTVFGSGMTNAPSEIRVRPFPEQLEEDRGDFLQTEDNLTDGLFQDLSGDLVPVLRYFLKDVSIQLSLYAGNDLSEYPSPMKSYCTESYKHGKGPEQHISENSQGGAHRDHSAYVVIEFSKITYLKQVFEKTASHLSSTFFQIGDIVVRDRVQASTIQEMFYQYYCSSKPRRSNTPIFTVKIRETQSREGQMRVSMLPIKINVDQDTMEFLMDFFEETSNLLDFSKNKVPMPQFIPRPVIEIPETAQKKTSPKTSVSSSDEEVTRMYPTIPTPLSTLNLEPLKPSPVTPATPLGDLSYLEKISTNHSSPVKRPIIDAPLTASAVSIGKMFDTPRASRNDDDGDDTIDLDEEMRVLNEIQNAGRRSSSSSSSSCSDDEKETSEREDQRRSPKPTSSSNLLSDLTGDWADDDDAAYTTCDYGEDASPFDTQISPIKKPYYKKPTALECGLEDCSDEPERKASRHSPVTSSPIKSNLKMKSEGLPPLRMPYVPPSNDDILMRSTMMGSIHPSQSVHNLVDTSDDLEEHGNFLDGLDDDDDEEKDKRQVEREMEDQKVDDASGLNRQAVEEGVERGETFYKQFVFSPSVQIYIDYQGKRKISVEKSGALVGLLMAFGQLNQMPIELREINTKTGLLGASRCFQYAMGEWSGDLLTNMPSVIASYGPISPLVQIGRGIFDLVWMPVSEFRKKDGNVVKGVQRGVGSFGTSSAAGIVGMAQTVTGFVQSIAEMTMREMRPDDPSTRRTARRYNKSHGMNPTDIRHSLQLAYGILYDGYHQTRDDLELAAQEDRASGNSVVRSAFRYAVPTFLGPVVMATQVTYQLLGGLRNQLRPDAFQDEQRKWGEKDVPGGVNHK